MIAFDKNSAVTVGGRQRGRGGGERRTWPVKLVIKKMATWRFIFHVVLALPSPNFLDPPLERQTYIDRQTEVIDGRTVGVVGGVGECYCARVVGVTLIAP